MGANANTSEAKNAKQNKNIIVFLNKYNLSSLRVIMLIFGEKVIFFLRNKNRKEKWDFAVFNRRSRAKLFLGVNMRCQRLPGDCSAPGNQQITICKMIDYCVCLFYTDSVIRLWGCWGGLSPLNGVLSAVYLSVFIQSWVKEVVALNPYSMQIFQVFMLISGNHCDSHRDVCHSRFYVWLIRSCIFQLTHNRLTEGLYPMCTAASHKAI